MTHHPHCASASWLMRAHDANDRRRYQRFERHGLVARLGDKLHEVHDVSVGGIRLEAVEVPMGAEMSITLFPRDGRRLDLSGSMTVRGEVVGHVDKGTRIRFPFMSYTLAKFLIQHLARRNGTQPYIFR